MIDRWVFCRCMKFSYIFRPNHEQGEEYATTGLLAGTEPACDLPPLPQFNVDKIE
jgi:hypothetical protein